VILATILEQNNCGGEADSTPDTFCHSHIKMMERKAMSGEKRKKPKAVHVTFKVSELDLIEDWRRAQPEIPALAATIRTFVIQGLKALPSSKDAAE
jgi:hypothetical protein